MLQQKIANLLSDTRKTTPSELNTILLGTFLISLLLSLTQIIADSVVNSDGIMYLQIASFIQKDEWGAAGKIYNWLSYSYIIAKFSSLTNLPLDYSAYFINACFTATTCTTFVLIIRELGAEKKAILVIAALIILCFPSLNEYRTMVVRDHGYWAFYLLSCYLFFLSYRKPSLKTLTLFITATILATLFRAEGAFFLLLTPFIIYQLQRNQQTKNRSRITQYYLYAFGIASLIALWFWISDTQTVGFSKITSQLTYMKSKLLLFFSLDSLQLQQTRSFLNALNPEEYSENYATAVLALTFLLILITEIIGSISMLYAIGLSISIYQKKLFPSSHLTRPWLLLLIINTIILCAFLMTHFFLTGRYPIALALTLLLPIPFLVNYFLTLYFSTTPKQTKHRWLSYFTLFIFISLSMGGLTSFGAKKGYLKEAGLWVGKSMPLKTTTLYSNSEEVIFYSNKFRTKRPRSATYQHVRKKIIEGELKNYNFLAIKVSHKTPNGTEELNDLLKSKPIKAFTNNRGDKLMVYSQL